MKFHRVKQKGDKALSQEYEKDRTVEHKKRKSTLPNIASPDMMDMCYSEFPNATSPVDMEEGVNDRKYDKNEKNDEEKDTECPDDTLPVDIEESVGDRNDNRNEKKDEGKEAEHPNDTSPFDMEEGVNDINDDRNKKNDEEKEAE